MVIGYKKTCRKTELLFFPLLSCEEIIKAFLLQIKDHCLSVHCNGPLEITENFAVLPELQV